jgi:hypothetical protein
MGLSIKRTTKAEQALEISEHALAIDLKAYGFDHPDVATDFYHKCLCLKALNRTEEAKQFAKQALDIAERKLGVNHPTTVMYRAAVGV